MSLPHLPTELKINIIEHLDPASTLHLALSSKAQFKLCEERLKEHATLFEKYSVIRPSDDGYLIWDITKEILKDPWKGWYVRELDLVSDRPEERPAGDIPDEDKRKFRAAVEQLEHLYSSESEFFVTGRYDPREWVDMMVNDINSGFEDPILVLLVHHLPWLHTFRMTDRSMSDTFQVFMRRVASGYQNPAIAPQMPLQHLQLAAIAHHDTEGHSSVDWAVYFVCIPSLKIFTAFMMGSEDIRQYDDNREAHLHNTARSPVSNVEELKFNGCQFDPDSFDTLLPLIKNLKRFEYDAGGHTVAEGQDVEPRRVIRALLAHAGHSLEELSLVDDAIGFDGYNDDDIRSVPVKGFKRLQALHCEAKWLLCKPSDILDSTDLEDDGLPEDQQVGRNSVLELTDGIKDPRDNLPQSLEYLYLDGIDKGNEWKDMLEMFKTTNANTPKLTLENSCLVRTDQVKYGQAAELHVRFATPLREDIWKGHSYFL